PLASEPDTPRSAEKKKRNALLAKFYGKRSNSSDKSKLQPQQPSSLHLSPRKLGNFLHLKPKSAREKKQKGEGKWESSQEGNVEEESKIENGGGGRSLGTIAAAKPKKTSASSDHSSSATTTKSNLSALAGGLSSKPSSTVSSDDSDPENNPLYY